MANCYTVVTVTHRAKGLGSWRTARWACVHRRGAPACAAPFHGKSLLVSEFMVWEKRKRAKSWCYSVSSRNAWQNLHFKVTDNLQAFLRRSWLASKHYRGAEPQIFSMQLNKGYPSLTLCDGLLSPVLLLFPFLILRTLATPNQNAWNILKWMHQLSVLLRVVSHWCLST